MSIATERREAVDNTKQRHLDLLARECRAAVNGLENALTNRRTHPTYGYTKASLKERYHRLSALLGAYGLIAGLQTHCGVDTPGADALGIDLRDLWARIVAS